MDVAPEQIAGMEINGHEPGSCLAWDPGSNLIATSLRSDTPKRITFCIVNPSTLKQHALLFLPGQAEADGELVSLEWSPVEQKRQLLAAMKSGRCMIWSQPSSSSPSSNLTDHMLTDSNWQCDQTFQTPCAPVALRWLKAPSPWKWPRTTSLQGAAQPQGIESPFGPHTSAQQELPWVRPGTVACAAIMQNGSFQVAWWARGFADFDFKWYQSAPLPLPLAGEMLTADMAVSSSGLIRVLVVSHLKPSQAVILTVSGNPTVLPPDEKPYEELRCEQTAILGLIDTDQSITSAVFQPDSAGTAAVLVSQSKGVFVLTRFTEDASSATWSQAASCTILVDGSPEGMIHMSHSHDGVSLLVSHPSPDGRTQLSVLDNESWELVRLKFLPGDCRGMAASSNMCCAATVHPALSGKGCRLVMHDLPQSISPSAEAADILSLRVCWSLVRRTCTWDVLRYMGARSKEQPNVVAELLARLDTALHTERYTQRPAYGMALNIFKLQLLADMNDPTARSVCMDVWARCYLQNLAGQLKLMCRPDKTAPESQLGHVMISAEDAAAVEPWVAWVEGFVAFLLGCLRRWVLARREAGTDAAKRAHADALPCARLLPDGYFTKNLCEVVTVCEVACTALEGGSSTGVRRAQFKDLAESVRAIAAATLHDQKAAGLTDSAQTEAVGAHLESARHAQSVFLGAYGLHYYRTLGGVRPVEAFTDASSGKLIAPLRDCKHWSDSDIEAAARRLGLTAPIHSSSSTSRKDGFIDAANLPSLHLDEGLFCLQTPEHVDMRSKRQRWQAERASALFIADDDTKSRSEIDIITGVKFSWAVQPKFVSVDGLCSTAGIVAQDVSMGGGLYSQIFGSVALSGCPVTGGSWQRLQ